MNSYPENIAIIMDGNRRWALNKNKPTIIGHRAGAQALKNIVKYASDIKIKELTVFAFSTENWLRPKSEIDNLLNLMSWYIKSEIGELNKNDIIIKVIGQREGLPISFCELINQAEKVTSNNKGLKLNIALNYGGKIDILTAVRSMVDDVQKGVLESTNINESTLENYLLSNSVSEIDLLIRTSGESRISNFLLWQICYSEIYFTETLWPDFNEKHFDLAIQTFRCRNRRFGNNSSKLKMEG